MRIRRYGRVGIDTSLQITAISLSRAKQSKERKKLRLQVLSEYGNKCACCGESRYEFLAIDHINGNGRKHLKKIGGNLYGWLKRNSYPKDLFQILCHNCNMAKGFYGSCPHTVAVSVSPGHAVPSA